MSSDMRSIPGASLDLIEQGLSFHVAGQVDCKKTGHPVPRHVAHATYMRADEHVRHRPERAVARQGFVREDIDTRACQMTRLQRRDQGLLSNDAATPDIQ